MSTADFQKALVRVCELLRGGGLPAADVDTFATQWAQKELSELEDLANTLKALEQAARALLAERAPQSYSLAKYPNVKVQLHDLDGKVGPVLRRVSYAMADAGVDEAEIEQYKREVAAGGDPVEVARRWVSVD